MASFCELMSDASFAVGYCNSVPHTGKMDCATASSGSWEWQAELSELSDKMRGHSCAARCLTCPRCNYVSFSLATRRCDWFHSCDTSALQQNQSGELWRTVQVRSVNGGESLLTNSSAGCSEMPEATKLHRPRRVIDLFPFGGRSYELQLVLRVTELYKVVDKFLVVEPDFSWNQAGGSRQSTFSSMRKTLQPFAAQLHHYVLHASRLPHLGSGPDEAAH